MAKNIQYKSIDYFKIVAAFLVVAIHTSPLASYSALGDFVLTRAIARIAVPFFLTVTGFFTLAPALLEVSASLPQTKNIRQTRVWRFLKKTLFLCLCAILLYLPVNLYAGQFKNIDALTILRMLLFDGTFYHLWYLPAVFLAMLLVILLNKRFSFQKIVWICLLLYVIGLFGDSYYGVIKYVPVIKNFYNAIFNIFSYTRNGLFYAPIFLIIGAWLHNPDENWQRRIQNGRASLIVGFILSMSAMIIEALTLHHLKTQRHDSMYIMLLPCIIFLFSLLLSIENKKSKLPLNAPEHAVFASSKASQNIRSQSLNLRSVSMGVYLLHPMIIIIVRIIAKLTDLEKILIDSSLIHYAVVSILSIMASIILTVIIDARKRQTAAKTDKSEKSERPKNFALLSMRHCKKFQTGRAWIELNQANLLQNVNALRQKMPAGCELMAAVKANAYGHGAALIAKMLNQAGVSAFCVADAMEGAQLRKCGAKGKILILGYTHPQQLSLLTRYRLTQTVIDYQYAQILNKEGKNFKAHIKIDTGMRRLGERSEQIEEISKIFTLENLDVEGVYTHLCADETTKPADRAYTLAQKKAFYDVILQLKKRGFSCPKIHVLASYGLINYPELAGNYARIGIALYGCLSNRNDADNCSLNLAPVLTLKARISIIKDLYKGESVGYNLKYTATEDKKIAALAIGYADGLPRALSLSVGHVLISGRRAPIIGRICMDQTIVDITDIPNVKEGDVAVIIGKSGEQEITVYDLAEWTGSIANEVFSRLGNRLERMIV